MMVTIKDLAELCGVSRGTVDRVLNGRGRVNPDKAELVREMAAKLNYRPNPAGKALSARKNTPVVGVLMPSDGVVFFDDVLSSMHRAANRYATYGLKVIWRSMHGFDAAEECQLIRELKDQVNALVLSPLNHPAVLHEINDCVERGIFVVTVNNDIEASKRHCYVGPDYTKGGRTAAGLLRMIHQGSIRAAVVLGTLQMLGHKQRLEGFLEVMEKDPNFQYEGVRETEDDEIFSYEAVRRLLTEEAPQTNAIFVASAGAYGAARAVLASGRKDITLIVFDTIPTTLRMMRQGVIQAAIYQHPHQQGRRSMQVAFDYLVNGIRPEQREYVMRNEIRILENALG